MSDASRDVAIECTDCGAEIVGLDVRVDAHGIVKGEHVRTRDLAAQSFVKLVVYDTSGGQRLARSEYRHAVCEPFDAQVPALALPDTLDRMFEQVPAPAERDSSLLLGKLREFADATPLGDGAGHPLDQSWQFAIDTYREWADLDLRDPMVQDAALMTLVHVRNALLANGEWAPEREIPARIVFTMLRIYAEERLRRT